VTNTFCVNNELVVARSTCQCSILPLIVTLKPDLATSLERSKEADVIRVNFATNGEKSKTSSYRKLPCMLISRVKLHF